MPRTPTSSQEQIQLLQQLLDKAGIRNWDVLLIGDGSGSKWQDACGWGVFIIDRVLRLRKLLCGGMNEGSVNLAETMPYFHALTWYDAQYGKARLRNVGVLNVHIITDSRVIAQHGTIAANPEETVPRVQLLFWAAMRELQRVGYRLDYHWMPRCTSEPNMVADLIASLSRRGIIEVAASESCRLATRAAAAMAAIRFADPITGEAISLHELTPNGAG